MNTKKKREKLLHLALSHDCMIVSLCVTPVRTCLLARSVTTWRWTRGPATCGWAVTQMERSL